MSFPVSGLLAGVPADAQMTSLGTSLSPAEITNGAQPQVPAAPGSHNSFLGFAVGLESRHPVLPPWPSPSKPAYTLMLSAFLKTEWGMLSSPQSVLGNSVITETGQAQCSRTLGHLLNTHLPFFLS